jgi:hypothetical protein
MKARFSFFLLIMQVSSLFGTYCLTLFEPERSSLAIWDSDGGNNLRAIGPIPIDHNERKFENY